MRIVHVSDCYAPRTGGIESQVRDLARAQVALGHEVHVLTATPGAAGHGGPPEDDGGVRVHRLGRPLPADLPVNPFAPPVVRALLEAAPPDVLHVHAGVLSPFAYDGARVAVAAGVPVAITWHCMLDGVVRPLRALVRATSWRTAPVALSGVSRAAAARVAEVFDAPVAVVPDGVDLDAWSPARGGRPEGDPPDRGGPLRVVATMRLAPRKRGPALVDVVAAAVRRLPAGALRLDVVGDGPARARVQARVDRHGLGGVVTLRGRLRREDLRAEYADADVFVAPAALEAFGIAALEARTSGLPVLARRGTGVAELVTDGVDGLLADDDAGLADALVRLASQDGLLADLTAAAHRTRPPFGWDRTVEAAATEYARARSLLRP